MADEFAFLNLNFFTKAEVYPGSIGTFRYRFKRSGWTGDGQLQVWVYENICFELAKDVETAVFPWTEAGVEDLRSWLYEKLRQRGSKPYRIPFPPAPPADSNPTADDGASAKETP